MLFPRIQSFIESLDIDKISSNRKAELLPLISYVQSKLSKNEDVLLNFICTHNSRRSHIGQIWAQTFAFYFGIKKIHSYSAGTEATAVYPTIIESLKKIGFEIEKLSKESNPVYSIKCGNNESPIIAFSKDLENSFNPKTDFAAVMTCDSANEACPFVAGSDFRIPVTFEDPKRYDNSPLEEEKYLERITQIATELLFIFNQIK